MSNPEFHGLKVIADAAVERGTLHVMRLPPEREEYDSAEAYEQACAEWSRSQFWHATITNLAP